MELLGRGARFRVQVFGFRELNFWLGFPALGLRVGAGVRGFRILPLRL